IDFAIELLQYIDRDLTPRFQVVPQSAAVADSIAPVEHDLQVNLISVLRRVAIRWLGLAVAHAVVALQKPRAGQMRPNQQVLVDLVAIDRGLIGAYPTVAVPKQA